MAPKNRGAAPAAAAEADKADESAAWSAQPKHAPNKHG
jgi:hypothetical protein